MDTCQQRIIVIQQAKNQPIKVEPSQNIKVEIGGDLPLWEGGRY